MFRARCLTEDQKNKLKISKRELGCIRPVHNGERGQCVIHVVPNENDSKNHILVDERCLPK